MRRPVTARIVLSLAALTAFTIGHSSPATAADAPPPSKNLLTLGLLGKLIPIPMPITQLSPILDGITEIEVDLEVPDPPTQPTYPSDIGGRAVGAYLETQIGDLLSVQTATLGVEYLGDWQDPEHHTVRIGNGIIPHNFDVAGVNVLTRSSTRSPWNDDRIAYVEAQVSRVEISTGLVLEGITSSVSLRQDGYAEPTIDANVAFGEVALEGSHPVSVPVKVPPNTRYEVPGLGTVILNEQTITRLPGDRYGARVHAVHVILDTALGDLPVGAELFLGTAEAYLYGD